MNTFENFDGHSSVSLTADLQKCNNALSTPKYEETKRQLFHTNTPLVLRHSHPLDVKSASHSELEGRKGWRVEAEPEVLALAECADDGLSGQSRFEFGWGDAVDNLGIIGYDRASDLLAGAVRFHRSPRRLYLRELRHRGLALGPDSRA